MKLKPEEHEQIITEMQVATQFNTKRWAQRFGISARQVKRLRAQAIEQLAATAQKGPVTCQVLVFNSRNTQRKTA